jgi:hypothetical protein
MPERSRTAHSSTASFARGGLSRGLSPAKARLSGEGLELDRAAVLQEEIDRLNDERSAALSTGDMTAVGSSVEQVKRLEKLLRATSADASGAAGDASWHRWDLRPTPETTPPFLLSTPETGTPGMAAHAKHAPLPDREAFMAEKLAAFEAAAVAAAAESDGEPAAFDQAAAEAEYEAAVAEVQAANAALVPGGLGDVSAAWAPQPPAPMDNDYLDTMQVSIRVHAQLAPGG